jgi:hypothetical protein
MEFEREITYIKNHHYDEEYILNDSTVKNDSTNVSTVKNVRTDINVSTDIKVSTDINDNKNVSADNPDYEEEESQILDNYIYNIEKHYEEEEEYERKKLEEYWDYEDTHCKICDNEIPRTNKFNTCGDKCLQVYINLISIDHYEQ